MRACHLAICISILLSYGCRSRDNNLSEVKDSLPIEKVWLDDTVSKIENLKLKSTDLVGAAISAQSDYSQGAATAIRTQTDALVQMIAELELFLKSQITVSGQSFYVPLETEVQGYNQIIGLRPVLNDIKRIRANIARDLESNLGRIASTNNTVRNSSLGVFISSTNALTTDLTKLEQDIRTWYLAGGGGTGSGPCDLQGFFRGLNGCWKEVDYNVSDCAEYCRRGGHGQGRLVADSSPLTNSTPSNLQSICQQVLSYAYPQEFIQIDSYIDIDPAIPVKCAWYGRPNSYKWSKFCPCIKPNDPQRIGCSSCYMGGSVNTYIYDIQYDGQLLEKVYADPQYGVGWDSLSCRQVRDNDHRCK